MKRLAGMLFVALGCFTPAALAQTESPSTQMWLWINFVLLLIGLGYLSVKYLGPFFAARSKSIRSAMTEADELRQEAEARLSQVERRLVNLESEIQALRRESELEAGSETERMRQQTVTEMAKIRAHAEQEIAAAGKAARLELKRFSARLAIRQAEQKVRPQITPATQDTLVRDFVRELDRPAAH